MLLRGCSVRIMGGIGHNLAGSMRSSDGCGGQDYGARADACSWRQAEVPERADLRSVLALNPASALAPLTQISIMRTRPRSNTA